MITAARFRLGTLLAGALIVAACTTGGDGSGTGSTDAPSTDAPSTEAPATDPPSTDAPPPSEPAGADTTPIEAPDPSGLPAISEADGEIVIGQLDNGIRYLIRENDNPGGRVEMRLAIDAGSALETDDQSGGAHFLEHMLFNGTEEFPENELIAVLRSFGAAFGADINAYTSYDETVYQLTMPTEDPATVETGLDVLEQWLTSATIDPDQVVAERGVVLDEWRGSAASSNGRIFDALEELYLAGSPYEGRDPIGTDTAIESTIDVPLRRFYDDHYRPTNASVIVVGSIDTGEIEQGIRDRFGGVDARGATDPGPDLVVHPSTQAKATVLADPDVAEGFLAVSFPLTTPTSGSAEALLQREILEDLAYDIVATRLENDALRGDAPFEGANLDSSSLVRSLSAPEIVVSADGPDLEAASQAVFDEYERVRRFGFTEAEVALAVSTFRSAANSSYEGRESRQDASFADEYVRHVLEDEPIPTAQATFDFINAVLDGATPETIAFGLVNRVVDSGAHVFVVVPDGESSEVPPADVFEAQAATMTERDLEPRDAESVIDGDLMEPPEPVEEIAREAMVEESDVNLVDPLLLTFANGVRVALNVTPIVEGNVAFEGRSPGGLAVVADEDVPDADAAGRVVDGSGVASFSPVELEAFLAAKDVDVRSRIDQFTEGFDGFVATDDLEVLMQLVHLRMTEPRVDDVALDRYVDDELAFAVDPSIDPGYAQFVALRDARYDDPRFHLPTVDSLATVDAEGVDEVYRDRFGDASDWSFSFSGDFDMGTAIELARRYLGTLPATGRVEAPGFDEPPPPPGIVSERVVAGEGEQANVLFLYTAPASAERRDDVAAQVVGEVVGNRLSDVIREQLGESYSPFAEIELTGGGTPFAETFVSVSTGRDLVDSVSSAVLAELDELRAAGPTGAEYDAASETVFQQLQLFNNPQINDEVLSVLVDPEGNPSLRLFLDQDRLVATIGPDDVKAYLTEWTPVARYIEIQTVPR
jgi:zinc protease